MLAARIGPAGVMIEQDGEEDPLADVVLAVSASTGAILGVLDGVLGAIPLTAMPSLVIVAAHVGRRRRIGIVAASLVWLRVLPLSQVSGMVTPLLMIGLCALLLAGPGRVLDWAEECWDARAERIRAQRLRAEREARTADERAGVGWIEDLPDVR